jgi:hypothetical protein
MVDHLFGIQRRRPSGAERGGPDATDLPRADKEI